MVMKMDGIIVVNKEKGMTSHDVVNIARKALHTKKVGHAGTLDPDATGVLVLAVNKATKALQFLAADIKEYKAVLSLGIATDSYDRFGRIIDQKEFTGYTNLEKTIESFRGDSMQMPPIYSAIKVNGKKLYEYARNNEYVRIEPRPVKIYEIEILKTYDRYIELRVLCSKGTYIRSLCFDIAKKLGYPGHMYALERTCSGHFTIAQACSIEQLKNNDFQLISLEDAFSSMDSLILEDRSIAIHGKKILSTIDHNVAVYDTSHHLLAIYGPDGEGHLKSLRGLF